MNKATFGKNIFLPLLNTMFSIAVLSVLMVTPAHAIKKCKDAQGRWHYGDVAVKACETSKITTLSKTGHIQDEKPAPKTEQELLEIAAQEKELESQRLILEEEKKKELLAEREKTRILSIYETEADIDRQRDNQLYSVDSNIAVHQTFLESMDEKIVHEEKKLAKTNNVAVKASIEERIAEAQKNKEIYTGEVDLLRQERLDIVKRFEKEKQLYLELTKDKVE